MGEGSVWDLRVRPAEAAAASGNLGSKKAKKKYKFSKFKSVLPKMLARSGLVGKNPPGPIWGHLRPFFPWTGKIKNMSKFRLFSLAGQLCQPRMQFETTKVCFQGACRALLPHATLQSRSLYYHLLANVRVLHPPHQGT